VSGNRIITEPIAVAPGCGLAGPGLYDAEGVNSWRLHVDDAHARSQSIVAQLWHPFAAEALDADAQEALVDAFRVAAEGASDAGFDGVALVESPRLTHPCREQVLEALVAVWGASRVGQR